MLTEQEIENFLSQMTPLELMMKRAYEAGDDILTEDASVREKYEEQFLRDSKNFDWNHPLNRIYGQTILKYHAISQKERGEETKKLILRRHMTHEDYALGNGKNIQIVRHSRYASARMHDHEFIEMSYVLSGSCRHEIESKEKGKSVQQVDLKMGDFMILPPGMRHQVSIYDQSVMINILMNTHTFEQVFLAHMPEHHLLYRFFWNIIFSEEQNSFILFETAGREEIRAYIFRLIAEYVQEDLYSEKVCEHLLEILFLKLMAYPGKPVFSENLPLQVQKVAPMILYLQEHFAEATLEDAAREFHYSKASVNRIFKKYTGITIGQFIRQQRLQRALELLKATGLSVQEIAEAAGYEDVSYFIEQFKNRFGRTPLQMRKSSEK